MGEDDGGDGDVALRRATHGDYEAVAAFTEDLWPDHGGDYLPRVYHDWLEDDDRDDKKTFLAEVDGDVAGIVQAIMLSDDEAWFQGMRVHPDHRRKGVADRLNEATVAWARERGATVARIMVYSWNGAGLGTARAGGFVPATEFRWAHPEPDLDVDGSLAVSNDPAAAWRFWTDSDPRDHLRGLALDADESWALSELTRADLERAADETALLSVRGDDGVVGVAYRTRDYERPAVDADGRERWAVYGVGAWVDAEAARSLLAAVARDAAALGADRTRVLVPENTWYVSDVAYAGVEVATGPNFVLGIDLT